MVFLFITGTVIVLIGLRKMDVWNLHHLPPRESLEALLRRYLGICSRLLRPVSLLRRHVLASVRQGSLELLIDVHQPQNLGNCRDFVRFLGARHLRELQPKLAGPDADRMQGTQTVLPIVGPFAPAKTAINAMTTTLTNGCCRLMVERGSSNSAKCSTISSKESCRLPTLVHSPRSVSKETTWGMVQQPARRRNPIYCTQITQSARWPWGRL